MMTNKSDANPITIPAIAHCGKNTSSSAYPTVGTTCLASTETERQEHLRSIRDKKGGTGYKKT